MVAAVPKFAASRGIDRNIFISISLPEPALSVFGLAGLRRPKATQTASRTGIEGTPGSHDRILLAHLSNNPTIWRSLEVRPCLGAPQEFWN